MAKSLQEQLLEAGLVTEQQLREAEKPPRRGPPREGRRGKRADGRGAARVSPPHQDRGRRGQAPARAPEPAPAPVEVLNKKIRGLLDEHRMNDDSAEVPYNFTRESRIKKIYVTEPQRTRLLRRELAIAGYRRVHHLIPVAVAEEILSLRPEIFVHLAGEDTPGEADPASDHPVPDDIVW